MTPIKVHFGDECLFSWIFSIILFYPIYPFSGLNASNEELNLKAHNIWAFTTNESGDTFDNYLDMDVEEAMDAKLPLMFISFPSAKGG